MTQPGSRRVFWLLLFQCLAFTLAAQVRISGRVTGPQNEGLPGITVQVQGTNFATSTDATGAYLLTTQLRPGTYELQFTGVGFRAETRPMQVSGNTAQTIDVQLAEDAAKMDEVVVTGTSAGTTRRQLGSYISTVRSEDLTKGVATNALQALQGKTAGAQITQNNGDPAGGISVRLRGISSISSSSEPLYIVDGVIVNNATTRVTNTSGNYDGANFIGTIGQNRMVDINPADIDRIEVLNGAAAAAIYGSRANAGVVQIFTKRGKSGAPQINFSTQMIVSSLRKQVPFNQAPTKFGGTPDAYTQDIIQTPLLSNTTAVTRYNYQDYIFRTGIGTDNNVSISAGSDRTRFFASGSYFYNQGIVKNTDFQRFSFRANVDQNISNTLSLTAGLNYTNSTANEKPDGNSFFSPLNSINIIGNFHDLFTRDANNNLRAVGERGRVNPVSVIEDIKQKQNTSRVIANAGLKFNPIRGLNFNYTIGFDAYGQGGTTFVPPFTYNASTAFLGGGAPGTPQFAEAQNGYASAASNNFFQVNHDLSGNYSFNINDKLGSVTQVGYSVQYERQHYVLAQGRGLAPVVRSVSGATTILPPADERTELSISGVYLQQNFKYNNNLFLTGAVRVDGSSVFGEDQRSQVYTKLSGSYVMSGDEWFKSKFFNLLKFRAAYGESGNLTGIGAYSRFNTYLSTSYLGRTSFTSPTTLANENVKPERQTEIEVGTDIAVLNNRISLTANYYVKRVKDLLINRVIAPTVGFSSLQDNFGELENKGFELILNASPVSSKDFQWNTTLIFNRNRNKAVRIGQSLTLLSINAGAPVAIIEGQPIGIFYGSFFARDANGGQVKNATGIPQIERGVQNSTLSYTPGRDNAGLPSGTTTLRKILGDPNPDWTGTLVNELSYKGFNFRLQFDAVQGVDVWNADWRTRQGVGNGEVAEQEHRGQLPRGYIAGIYAIEEWRIDDGSFVKLREASLSYNFGTRKMFKDLTLSVSGRNLVSFDNYKGYDPEVNAGGQSTILRGIDFGAIPIPRTISFGLSTKF